VSACSFEDLATASLTTRPVSSRPTVARGLRRRA
jgi:hypothetical protein